MVHHFRSLNLYTYIYIFNIRIFIKLYHCLKLEAKFEASQNLFSFFRFMLCGESLMSESSRDYISHCYVHWRLLFYDVYMFVGNLGISNIKWIQVVCLGLKDEIRQYHEIMKALMSMLIRSKMKRNHKL